MHDPAPAPEADRRFDALLPPEMAHKAESIGVAKASMQPARMLVLAILAGAFIALGAVFSTVAVTGAAGALPYGITRVIAGLTFSLGLILVVVGGAELFTGNTLLVMAWVGGKLSLRRLLASWAIVYVGNAVGAVATAFLVVGAGHYQLAGGAVGLTMLSIAQGKLALDFVPALLLGVLCNGLVCLAVWLSLSARSTTDRLLAVVPPVTAFVAAGFEHSIANLYFVPAALFVKWLAPASFWAGIDRQPAAFDSLDLTGFLADNLVPVTIGNLLGGALLVGATYWFVYLRQDARR
jgi:formate transporter